MAAPPGSAKELDEDAGREEGLPTPGGKWDEGEQGPGGIGELEEENGVGGRAKDRNQGGSNRDTGDGVAGEGSHRPEGIGRESRSSVCSVIGRRETSTIELWKVTRS